MIRNSIYPNLAKRASWCGGRICAAHVAGFSAQDATVGFLDTDADLVRVTRDLADVFDGVEAQRASLVQTGREEGK